MAAAEIDLHRLVSLIEELDHDGRVLDILFFFVRAFRRWGRRIAGRVPPRELRHLVAFENDVGFHDMVRRCRANPLHHVPREGVD